MIRACRELGIETVAIYSEADRDALHVWAADEAICVGPAPSADSYLNIPNIISAAVLGGRRRDSPGLRILVRERAHFAEICETHGIKFIGLRPARHRADGGQSRRPNRPWPQRASGDPGQPRAGADGDEAVAMAEEIGYPVMVKAAAGGGGKGMRIARRAGASFSACFEPAQSEAEAAFGSDALYIEKVIESSRHIEIQILARRAWQRDSPGRAGVLAAAPAPKADRRGAVARPSTPPLREAMGEAAVQGGAGSRLHQRRHDRVPAGRRR